jgi:hypothetical protein
VIKAAARMRDENGEGRLVILGLSAANTQRLLAGQPIRVDLSELIKTEPHVVVLLVGGETEQSIQSDLAQHFHLPKEGLDGPTDR